MTYERSRDARVEESAVKDVYTMVYDAAPGALHEGRDDATHGRAGCPIGIREDSTWNVPEPEIGVVLGKNGRIAGHTIGTTCRRETSRARTRSTCPRRRSMPARAFGPSVFVSGEHARLFEPTLRVTDEWGQIVFEGETSTARMKRSFDELVHWLTVDNPVPYGSILLTGTGLVPPDSFTLLPATSSRSTSPRSARSSIPSCVPPSSSKRSLCHDRDRDRAPARNYVGGEWRESAGGETYEKRSRGGRWT